MSFASHFMLDIREKSHYFWLRYSHVSLYNMSCQLPARYNIRRRIQSADLSAIRNVSRDESRYGREGEREGRTQGRQHRAASFQVENLALSSFAWLFAAVLLAGQAEWSMGCEITTDVMGRKLLYLWRKTVGERCHEVWLGAVEQKGKEKRKKFDT